jgi:hypothetical protein
MSERGWRRLMWAGAVVAGASAGLFGAGAFHIIWSSGLRYMDGPQPIRWGLCLDEGLFQLCNRMGDDHEGWWCSPGPVGFRTVHLWPSRTYPLADAYRKPQGPSTWGWSISLPLWMPAAVGVMVAGWGGTMARRLRGRRLRGDCIGCGYDRHGLAADAKCPECGMVTIK